MEAWSGQVTSQLRTISSPSAKWNQSVAAFQLLCVGAAIIGRLKPGASIAEMIDAAFANWLEEPPASAPELRNLYGKIVKQRESLSSIARSQLSSMKGGRAGSMLEARLVVPPIRALRRAKWVLELEPPENDLGPVAKLYREVRTGLESATEAERAVRLSWIADMDAAFGVDANRASIVSALEAARQAAVNAGVATQNVSTPFAEALDQFRSTQFDAAVAAARELAQSDTALATLPNYGRGNRNAVDAGTLLRSATEKFFEAVERSLEAYGQDQNAGINDVEQSMKSIDKSLEDIVADLKILKQRKEPIDAP